MQKIKVEIITVLFFILLLPSSISAETVRQQQEQESVPCDVLKDAFVSQLFDVITQAIVKEYGDDRQFMVEKVVEIKRVPQGQYNWETTLIVSTFQGPHNPPYHYYKITITNVQVGKPRVIKIERIATR